MNTKYEGTGIGLAFSKQLIEYMKGEIWAESAGENKGSTFFIRLKKGKEIFGPEEILEEPDQRPAISTDKKSQCEILKTALKEEIFIDIGEPKEENDFDHKKGVILIIDDDRTVTGIVKDYLSINGFSNFIIATGGKTGLEAIYDITPMSSSAITICPG